MGTQGKRLDPFGASDDENSGCPARRLHQGGETPRPTAALRQGGRASDGVARACEPQSPKARARSWLSPPLLSSPQGPGPVFTTWVKTDMTPSREGLRGDARSSRGRSVGRSAGRSAGRPHAVKPVRPPCPPLWPTKGSTCV